MSNAKVRHRRRRRRERNRVEPLAFFRGDSWTIRVGGRVGRWVELEP